MNVTIRNGLRAGLIFGLVILFLILIGFTMTGSKLIMDFMKSRLGIQATDLQGIAIFIGLLGLWAGAYGARKVTPDTWSRAILASLIAGAIAGLIVGAFVLLIGRLSAPGVDFRKYLAQLSPEHIQLLLFSRDPFSGALVEFSLLIVSGLAGGLLARGIGRGGWRDYIARWRQARRESGQQIGLLEPLMKGPWSRIALYAVLLGLLVWLPTTLSSYWNFTLGTVGIYVLMGLGLNIVVGLAGLLDLGYVAFFAIGAYTIGLLTTPQMHALEWNFWVALPIGVLIAASAGVLLGIPVLRLRGDYLAIVTLGFGEIIRILAKSDALKNFLGGPQGVRDIAGPSLFGLSLNTDRGFFYMIILAIFLVIFVTQRLQNSRVGRAWIAMREDETVAQAMGISTLRYKLLAFAIGVAFAGLGGVLFASRNQYTGPEDHTLLVSINVLSLVIVGGMGSIPGVILGALALKGLPEMLRQLEDYRILAFGALLVVMMILRPEGLWPSTRRRLEVHDIEAEKPPEPVHPVSADLPASPGVTATTDVTISTDLRES